MIITEAEYNELLHYGTLRKSGRYPWGSGDNQTSRNQMFLNYVDEFKKQGLTDAEIGRGLGVYDPNGEGISSTKLRLLKSLAKNEIKQAEINQAQKLRAKGMSPTAIGLQMGKNESSIRALLSEGQAEKAEQLTATAEMLKRHVAEKKYIDVGSGVEKHMNISVNKLATAVQILKEEGYELHSVDVLQLGTGLETRMKVLAPPGTTQKEVWLNRDNIKQIMDFTEDDGASWNGVQPPLRVNPSRVAIKYGSEGGAQADGVIYVRDGVPDVSLGNSRYAQVRIAVGDGHYLKGMAMYKEDLPKGVDLLFNTNKESTGNPLDAMKEISSDPNNPFGAVIRPQQMITLPDGTRKVSSAMNIVNEEGDWTRWSKSIASQVLSKQSPAVAKTQLDMTYERRKRELDRITQLTNPTVRRKLLEEFSDSTDSAAVHLKAAALPKTGWHAILPIDDIPPGHIYAPNYENGTRVALIRYPHGGRFEIPELVVNNNHPTSKRLLGNAKDAVGIHHTVAERLSGADFDGDTVLVIPNNHGKIKSEPALEGLKDFNPRLLYKGYEGMKKMTPKEKGLEMGKVSNLITDMTLQKASTGDLARAIRHSMVVIDAEKHGLNYRQSAIDNGIGQLKAKYQGKSTGGAATLISRAGAKDRVNDAKRRRASEGGSIDKVTGKVIYEPTNKLDYRTGLPKQMEVKRLAITDDARTLLSGPTNVGTPMERLYADHSNRLKQMANEARLLMINTPALKQDKSAKIAYGKEVQSLDAKLSLAVRNRPLERQAQIFANAVIKAKRNQEPDMAPETLKKIKYQALTEMRRRTGADKARVEITQSEWNAIQAGAVSDSKLSDILDNANMDIVRDLATPKSKVLMTPANTRRAMGMLSDGYTRAEVAAHLGVSLSTLDTVTTGS